MHLGLVIPCFNEEQVLDECIRRVGAVLADLVEKGKIDERSHVCFVDDGSRDNTWKIIQSAALSDSRVRGIRLSRNRGHQNALLAGLLGTEGDALISLDADLQDDLAAIEHMVDAFLGGNQVVFGVRSSRAKDTVFKRNSARGFYRLMSLLGADTVSDHADFRLLSRTAIEGLRQYGEVNMFLRGIVPLLGYRTTSVAYERSERFAGESKYPLRKMLAFALEGITSFSTVPLRLITVLGLAVAFGSVLMSIWTLAIKLFTDDAIPGWASTVLPTYFLGGVQLLSLGVIGEYLGKVYMEVKRRPRYFVEERC